MSVKEFNFKTYLKDNYKNLLRNIIISIVLIVCLLWICRLSTYLLGIITVVVIAILQWFYGMFKYKKSLESSKQ